MIFGVFVFKLNLLIQFHGNFSHELVLAMFNLTVGMVPLLATSALNPDLAIHLSILCGVVVNLVAVVALHVLVKRDVAALTEVLLLTVLQFDLLEDSGKNLLDLLFIYSFIHQVITRCSLDWHRRLDQTKWTELVEALLHDLREVID